MSAPAARVCVAAIAGAYGVRGEVRFSCQIPCNADMTVEPLMSIANTGQDGRGIRPQDHITPDPVWVDKPEKLTLRTRLAWLFCRVTCGSPLGVSCLHESALSANPCVSATLHCSCALRIGKFLRNPDRFTT